MSAWNQKINPYLAIFLVLMVASVSTFLILLSLNQPRGLQIDSQAVNVNQ